MTCKLIHFRFHCAVFAMRASLLGLVLTCLSTNVLMLPSALVAGPKIVVPERIPSGSTGVTTLEKLEKCVSVLQGVCLNGVKGDPNARDEALRTIVSQLRDQTERKFKLDMTHSRTINLGSVGEWEANTFFTDRVPQLQSATIASLDLGNALEQLNDLCCRAVLSLVLGNVNSWLPNCIATMQFKEPPPKSYQEGAVAIEFRKKQ
ncbi:hypothetical protein EJ04DRAFT_557868 [Polyplosphaeria fusca]|uniref:Uncharacterized protein n=1 Tax=Polyplosphaeria fusca TaxID=682080 RepID=A0A9P4UVA3_9PLEO|nr:hypothetical protein EJ04DRAFT_557868 [Polyplosphaeria fusca]